MIAKLTSLVLAFGVLVAATPCPKLPQVDDVYWYTAFGLRPDPSWSGSGVSIVRGHFVAEGSLTVAGDGVDSVTVREDGRSTPITVAIAFPLYIHDGDAKGTHLDCIASQNHGKYSCDSDLVSLWGGGFAPYMPQLLEIRVESVNIPGETRPVLITHDISIVSRDRCPSGVIVIQRTMPTPSPMT